MSSKGHAEDSPIVLEEQIDRKDGASVEEIEKVSSNVEIGDPDSELLLPSRRPIAERKLVRVLDFRLLPTIVLIFILNYIDVSVRHYAD